MNRIGVLLALMALVGGTAFAQSSDPEAKQHYDQATAAYGLGRYAEAAAEFERAYELKPQPALLFNAAQAHREAGNRERALVLYKNYLRLYGSQVTNGEEVRRIIVQLEAAIASQQPAPPPASSPPPTLTPAPEAATSSNALVASAPAPRKPIYKRAWFWGAVGGGAAVVATAIALGVVYGSTTKNPTPSIGTWAY